MTDMISYILKSLSIDSMMKIKKPIRFH